jgi:acyl-coenzyme A thioesterase 13
VNHGFTPYERSSPFFDLIGPLLSRRGPAGPEFALEIDERHVNDRGFAHAGVLSAVADVALGYATAFSQDPPVPLLTTSLTVDFAGRVAPGDTLVANVDVQRVGRRIAFANCYLSVNDRRIARASAVFANVAHQIKT